MKHEKSESKTLVYCRKSKMAQDKDSHSQPAQEEAIEEYSIRRGQNVREKINLERGDV